VVDTASPVQSTESTDAVSGSAAAGEALFKSATIAGVPGCATCHSLQPGVRLVGPSLADAATVAASAVDGMSAEAFLRQSIIEPDAHVTEGFMPGLMLQTYGEILSEEQINSLVAFLLTQTAGNGG
jgi:mono/diheme cytochrome c family protein